MSTNINIGNQSITFQYYQEAKSRSFNELLYKVVPQGILDGGEISIVSDTVVSLNKLSLMLEVPTETNDINIKISTRDIIQLSPTEENCYIVGEYDWIDFKDNYMEFKCIRKSAILNKHIIFGKVEYINGVPNSIDYTERTLSKLYHATHSNYSNFLVTTDGLSKNIIVKKGRAFIGGKLVSISGDYTINNIFEEVNYGMTIKVYIGQDGIPDCVQGEDSTEYLEPNIPNNTLLLGIIRIPPNASVILGDYITQVTDFDINTSFNIADDELSKTSTNSIQNSTVTKKFESIESYVDNSINTNVTSKLSKSNGIATLDENGRIPVSQLPESALEYKGNWNASTNTPTLVNGTGTKGDFYICTVGGTVDFGGSSETFTANDRVLYDGSVWTKLGAGAVQTVNDIEPVNGNVKLPNGSMAIMELIDDVLYITVEEPEVVWVACGAYDDGLYYSVSGKTWKPSNETDNGFSGGARYGNGIWVACGNRGGSSNGLYYSTDGKNWTQSNITSGHFGDARYSNGIWVACCDIGLYYSTDGKTWIESNVVYRGSFNGGARYSNGIWVACGGGNNGLYYSTDGKTWAESNITSGSFNGGARYGNGIWVACSRYNDNDDGKGLYYSTDGKTWTQSNITSGSFIGGARYSNGIWVACSTDSNGLYYSTDGKNWTQSNITDGSFNGGARYSNGIWVACSYGNGLYWSTDGEIWRLSSITSGYFDGGARYGNGIWVACSSGGGSTDGLYYSTDGKTWTRSNITSGSFIGAFSKSMSSMDMGD